MRFAFQSIRTSYILVYSYVSTSEIILVRVRTLTVESAVKYSTEKLIMRLTWSQVSLIFLFLYVSIELRPQKYARFERDMHFGASSRSEREKWRSSRFTRAIFTTVSIGYCYSAYHLEGQSKVLEERSANFSKLNALWVNSWGAFKCCYDRNFKNCRYEALRKASRIRWLFFVFAKFGAKVVRVWLR